MLKNSEGIHQVIANPLGNSLSRNVCSLAQAIALWGMQAVDRKSLTVAATNRSGQRSVAINYRPAGLPRTMSDYLTRLIRGHIGRCLTDYGPSHKIQRVFLRVRSLPSSMLIFWHEVIAKWNETVSADVCYFEFCKAFDLISRRLLMRL